MIKTVGAICILLTTSCLGFMKGEQYKERIRYLKVLEMIFRELLTDIHFGKITFSESFGRIAGNVPEPYDRLLKNLCGELKWKRGRSFACIFSEEVDKCLENSFLEPSDIQELKELGNIMDGADRDTQVHVIENYLQNLKKQRDSLEESSVGQQKVCQALGISGGVFLLIILL